jgi:hypothetical protein
MWGLWALPTRKCVDFIFFRTLFLVFSEANLSNNCVGKKWKLSQEQNILSGRNSFWFEMP